MKNRIEKKTDPRLGSVFTKHSKGVPEKERQLLIGDELSPFHFHPDSGWECRVHRWWKNDIRFVGMVYVPPDEGSTLEKRWERGTPAPDDGGPYWNSIPQLSVTPHKWGNHRRTSAAVDHAILRYIHSTGCTLDSIDARHGVWCVKKGTHWTCADLVGAAIWAGQHAAPVDDYHI